MIAPSDIVGYLTGGPTNTLKSKSFGGQISSTVFPFDDITLPNLFDDVDEIKSTAGHVDYRCIAIKNTHATQIWYNVRARILRPTTSHTTRIEIGADPVGVVVPSATNKAAEPSSEIATPSGVSFVAPRLQDYTALSIGTILPNHAAFLWIKWVINPGTTAQDMDAFKIELFGGSKQ